MKIYNNNVGIDARPLEGNITGIGRFLIDNINAIFVNDKNLSLYMYSNRKVEIPGLLLDNKVKNVIIPGTKFLFDLILPIYLIKNRIGTYLGFNQSVPIFGAKKKILYIYDMSVFVLPDTFSLKWRIYIKFWIYISSKLTHQIITISESSKKDIQQILNIQNKRIDIIYPWYDNRLGENEQNNSIQNEVIRKINKPFILFVGTIKKRKNIERLLEAYHKLILEYKIDIDIVLAGKIAKGKEAADISINKKISERIHLVGYVNDLDLIYLYRNAKLFVYPSLYEGFGIPILEAMAYGIPVVASNVGSMKEIVGDAGILVNPLDVLDITNGLYKALSDVESITNSIIISGYKRLSFFNKADSEEKIKEVFLDSINK